MLALWNHPGRTVVGLHNLLSHLAFSRVAIVSTTAVCQDDESVPRFLASSFPAKEEVVSGRESPHFVSIIEASLSLLLQVARFLASEIAVRKLGPVLVNSLDVRIKIREERRKPSVRSQ